MPAAVYILFIILSTVTSKYSSVALTGFVARYEGMFVLLFYIINMLILFNLISEERQIGIIFKSLLVSAFIICLIGLLQLAGRDSFETGWEIPPCRPSTPPANWSSNLAPWFMERWLTQTMGSYVALVFPIAWLRSSAKKKGLRVAAAVLSVLLLVNLIGAIPARAWWDWGGILIILFTSETYIQKIKQSSFYL